MIERDQRSTKSYMSSFEGFFKMVEEYRIDHNLDAVKPYYKKQVLPCSECGFTNELEFELCTNCGSSIKIICSNCGQSYDSQVKFCGKCGVYCGL
jgi:hypothetical protein